MIPFSIYVIATRRLVENTLIYAVKSAIALLYLACGSVLLLIILVFYIRFA